MHVNHAPSTEPFFRALQRDREREVLRLARSRPARGPRQPLRAGRALLRLAAAVRRLQPTRRRSAAAGAAHVGSGRRSHPGIGTQRSTTAGVPCPSCA